jgi:hypothetical protein
MAAFLSNRVELMPRRWWIRCLLLGAVPLIVLAQRRAVHGFVRDQDGRAIRAAGVQLKDLRTLEIRTYLTDGDGLYNFSTLNPEADYQLKAVYEGRFSEERIIDRFASAPDVTVNLRIDLKAPAKGAKE